MMSRISTNQTYLPRFVKWTSPNQYHVNRSFVTYVMVNTTCRFQQATCRACSKKGHIAKACRSKSDYFVMSVYRLGYRQPHLLFNGIWNASYKAYQEYAFTQMTSFVSGKTREDHLQNLTQVLKCLEKADSLSQVMKSIEYLGHVIDSTGLHPSPSKIKAIQQASEPSNVTELSRSWDYSIITVSLSLIYHLHLLPFIGYYHQKSVGNELKRSVRLSNQLKTC